MNLKERAIAGVFGGLAATVVLSDLREALTRFGLVFETAPMQVVNHIQEVGLVEGSSASTDRPVRQPPCGPEHCVVQHREQDLGRALGPGRSVDVRGATNMGLA